MNASRYQQARERLGDLRTYLMGAGVEFRGKNFRCIMPGHEDKNPSSTISANGQSFKCFSCGDEAWGSVLDAYAILNNTSVENAVDDILGRYDIPKPKPTQIRERKMNADENLYDDTKKPKALEGDDLLFMQDCADNLYASPADILRIARWRRWSPKTIARLATDRSIGVAPDGRLTFNYATGVKYRQPDGASPKVLWRKGSKQCLWRFQQMILAAPQTVYITEGETDAITLIDDGLEPEWFNRNEMLAEAHTMVVALPSASYTLSWELHELRGIDVVIWGDNDAAGIEAARRNADAISSVAKSVRMVSP